MGYREKILELLYKKAEKVVTDLQVYQKAAETSKRQMLKNFFGKLAHQKKSFLKRIKQEIAALENELEIMGVEFRRKNVGDTGKKAPTLSVFELEKEGTIKEKFIKECYSREKRNYEQYNFLLSKISKGSIREMLLFQKHSVGLLLEEVKSMGVRIFDGVEDEYNRGEVNYR